MLVCLISIALFFYANVHNCSAIYTKATQSAVHDWFRDLLKVSFGTSKFFAKQFFF